MQRNKVRVGYGMIDLIGVLVLFMSLSTVLTGCITIVGPWNRAKDPCPVCGMERAGALHPSEAPGDRTAGFDLSAPDPAPAGTPPGEGGPQNTTPHTQALANGTGQTDSGSDSLLQHPLPPDQLVCPDAQPCLTRGVKLLDDKKAKEGEALLHLAAAVQHAPQWELARMYLAKGMRESRTVGSQNNQIILGKTIMGHLKMAMELGSFNPQTYYLIAMELDDRGDVSRAVEAYSRSVELRGDNLQARIRLGMLLQGEGRDHEALKHMKEAYLQDRDHVVVNTQLARLYEKVGMEAEAETHLMRLCTLEKAAPWPYTNLAAFYHRQGNKGKEERAREQAEKRRVSQISGGKVKTMRPLPAAAGRSGNR